MSTIKKNTKKEEKQFLQFGTVRVLSAFLPGFLTPTYADMIRIDGIMKEFETIKQEEQDHIAAVFKKNNLTKDEEVSSTHPLFRIVHEEIGSGLSTLELPKIKKFTLKEFNSSVDGLNFSYNDRKLLHFHLVIEEEVQPSI